LQYNARCEFFTNGFFPPSPECRDGQCLIRQQEVKAKGKGWLEQRKERVANAKKLKGGKNPHFLGDEVDPAEWGIELVGESAPPKAEVFVDKKKAEEESLEDLMSRLQKVSLKPAGNKDN
jgi:hypothetical protein